MIDWTRDHRGRKEMNHKEKLALPLRLVIQIDSTNLRTRGKALEHLLKVMLNSSYSKPELKQIIFDSEFENPYWRLEVLELVNNLPESR